MEARTTPTQVVEAVAETAPAVEVAVALIIIVIIVHHDQTIVIAATTVAAITTTVAEDAVIVATAIAGPVTTARWTLIYIKLKFLRSIKSLGLAQREKGY